MKQKRFFTALLLAMIIVMAAAVPAAAAIPEVSESFYVADYADVISDETEAYIVEKNAELEYYCSGAQVVIVTVDFLDGMDIEDYCYKLFNEWKIGASGENNGVLLLLTIGEENYWCMTGKGLEGELTAGELDELLWIYLEDSFAAEMYDFGVKTTFDQLYSELYDIYSDVDPYVEVSDDLTLADWIIVFVFIVAPFVIALLIIRAIIKAIIRRIKYGPAVRPVVVSTRPVRRVYIPTTVHRPHRPVSRPTIWDTRTFDDYPPVPPHRPPSNSFGGSRPVSRPSRPSSFGSGSSFGGGGGMGHGGGGSSRGGGAGRRGR